MNFQELLSSFKPGADVAPLGEKFRSAAAALAGKRLVIVADGILQYIPFAALNESVSEAPLIAGHELDELPSASALSVQRAMVASRKPAPMGIAVIADPVFSPADPRVGRQEHVQVASAKSDTDVSRLLEHLQAQGGDVSFVDHPEKLPQARLVQTVNASRSGWLSEVNARDIGEASVALGAGRARKSDPVDHAVGFLILRKVGDRVEQGEPLFVVHADDEAKAAAARDAVLAAHAFSDVPVPPLPLFYE